MCFPCVAPFRAQGHGLRSRAFRDRSRRRCGHPAPHASLEYGGSLPCRSACALRGRCSDKARVDTGHGGGELVRQGVRLLRPYRRLYPQVRGQDKTVRQFLLYQSCSRLRGACHGCRGGRKVAPRQGRQECRVRRAGCPGMVSCSGMGVEAGCRERGRRAGTVRPAARHRGDDEFPRAVCRRP